MSDLNAEIDRLDAALTVLEPGPSTTCERGHTYAWDSAHWCHPTGSHCTFERPEIKRARAELSWIKPSLLVAFIAEIRESRAEILRLRGALEPFKAVADEVESRWPRTLPALTLVPVPALLAAREALNG